MLIFSKCWKRRKRHFHSEKPKTNHMPDMVWKTYPAFSFSPPQKNILQPENGADLA